MGKSILASFLLLWCPSILNLFKNMIKNTGSLKMRIVLNASTLCSHFLQYHWFWLSSCSVFPNLLKQSYSFTVCLFLSLAFCNSCWVFSSCMRWQSVNLSLLINSKLYLTCNFRLSFSSSDKSNLAKISHNGSSEGGIYWYTVSVEVKNYIFLTVLKYLT